MEIYCLKCKGKTETTNIQTRIKLKKCSSVCGNCQACGTKKNQFIGYKIGGDITKFLNRMGIGELHLPGYNFCGPNTELEKRLNRGDVGVNRVDDACKLHDIAYSQLKDLKERHIADQQLLDDVASIDKPTFNEWLGRLIVKAGMNLKLKLGLGHSKNM